jgi:histidine ammonia-lyase
MNLTLQQLQHILFEGGKLELSTEVLQQIEESYNFLSDFAKTKSSMV